MYNEFRDASSMIVAYLANYGIKINFFAQDVITNWFCPKKSSKIRFKLSYRCNFVKILALIYMIEIDSQPANSFLNLILYLKVLLLLCLSREGAN